MTKLLQHIMNAGGGKDKYLPFLEQFQTKGEYTGPSIVDYLATRGYSGKKSFRKELAGKYGIEDYDYSAHKNLELLAKLRENEDGLEEYKQAFTPVSTEQLEQIAVKNGINRQQPVDNYPQPEMPAAQPTFSAGYKNNGVPMVRPQQNAGVYPMGINNGFGVNNAISFPKQAPVQKVQKTAVNRPQVTPVEEVDMPAGKNKQPDMSSFDPMFGPMVGQFMNKAFQQVANPNSTLNRIVDKAEKVYKYGPSWVSRHSAMLFGDDEDTISTMPVNPPPKVLKTNKTEGIQQGFSPITTGTIIKDDNDMMHRGPGFYHTSELIDLDKFKFGYHNRDSQGSTTDQYNVTKTDGLVIPVFSTEYQGEVDNDDKGRNSIRKYKDSEIKDGKMYAGIDDTGKFHLDYGKNLKGKNLSMADFRYADVTGFARDKNGQYVLGDETDNKAIARVPHLIDAKGKEIHLNVLVPKHGDDQHLTYGETTGGRFIITTPDMKNKFLASGSLQNLNDILEKFKKTYDTKTVRIVFLDNGTFSRGLRKTDKKIYKNDWKRYDNANEMGGAGFYYYEDGGELPKAQYGFKSMVPPVNQRAATDNTANVPVQFGLTDQERQNKTISEGRPYIGPAREQTPRERQINAQRKLQMAREYVDGRRGYSVDDNGHISVDDGVVNFMNGLQNMGDRMLEADMASSIGGLAYGAGRNVTRNFLKQAAKTAGESMESGLLSKAYNLNPRVVKEKLSPSSLKADFIDPFQDMLEKKRLMKWHASAEKRFNRPEARKRLEETLGIDASKMEHPKLTVINDHEHGSHYNPNTNSINIDLEQARNIKKKGITINPRSIYEHEVAHFLQREAHRFSPEHVEDLIDFNKNGFGQKYPQLKPVPYAKPTAVDLHANHVFLDSNNKFGVVQRNNKSMDNALYFMNGDVEQFAHLREMRQNMLNNRFIKNIYEDVPESTIADFIKKQPTDRISSFMSPTDDVKISGLSDIFKTMPAVIPAAMGAGALSQKKKGGELIKAQNGFQRMIPQVSQRNALDNTRNIPVQFVHTNSSAKILADRQARIKGSLDARSKPFSSQQLADETQAIGDKLRLFPNDPDNVFDEYLNPGVFIGNLASHLGRVPLNIQQGNYGDAAMAFAEPLALGAAETVVAPWLKKAGKYLSSKMPAGLTESGLLSKPYDLGENKVFPKFSSEQWKEAGGYLERRQFLKNLQKEGLVGTEFSISDLNNTARSTDKTNKLTQLALDRYHTGFRNVFGKIPEDGVGRQAYTNQKFDMSKPAYGQSISEFENMKKAGVDFTDSKSIAEYQATHIPLQDYGYRATGEWPTSDYGFLFRSPSPSLSKEYGNFLFKGNPSLNYEQGKYNDWFKDYFTNLEYHHSGNTYGGSTSKKPASLNTLPWQKRVSKGNRSGIGDVTLVGPRGAKAYEIDQNFPFQNVEEVVNNPTMKKSFDEYVQKFNNQFSTGWRGEYKKGGVITDPRGQWAHPGRKTMVPTPTGQITMKGVPYPVYGQDETGYAQMMYPGMEYQYPGQMVHETPMMELGGIKSMFKMDPKRMAPVPDNTRVIKSSDVAFKSPTFKDDGPGQVYAKRQFEKAKEFHNRWMISPMYKEMILKSSPESAVATTKLRRNNMNDVKFTYDPVQPKGMPYTGGYSKNYSGDVTVLPLGIGVNGMGVHELSHSIDRPYTSESRLIPEKDIQNISKSAETNRKKHENQEWFNYVTEPTETRARLNDIRQQASQNNLYDPFVEKVTPEIYKKLKNFEFEKGDKKGFDALKQLQDVYNDDQIINFLNTISKNKSERVLDQARYGGLLGRTVTCSGCGHSWKSTDGGQDPLSCHNCGGIVKMQKGGLAPIYVNNPRDPKLRAYQDSLKLYKQNFNQLKSEKKSNYAPIKFIKRIPFSFFGNTDYAEDMFEKNDAYDTRSTGEVYPEKIKPIYFDINQIGEKTQHSAYYKKPVQPVAYRKPKPVVSTTSAEQQVVPPQQAVQQQQMVQPPSYKMQGVPVYGPSYALIGTYDNKAKKFYPDYNNEAGRARVNQADTDMMGNPQQIQSYLRSKGAYGDVDIVPNPKMRNGGMIPRYQNAGTVGEREWHPEWDVVGQTGIPDYMDENQQQEMLAQQAMLQQENYLKTALSQYIPQESRQSVSVPRKKQSSYSLVDHLTNNGEKSNYASRKKIAEEKYGFQNYTGTADQTRGQVSFDFSDAPKRDGTFVKKQMTERPLSAEEKERNLMAYYARKISENKSPSIGQRSSMPDETRKYLYEKRQQEILRKQLLKGADVASDIMQLGNFVPVPQAQFIGEIGNGLGMLVDGYQAYDDFSQGNYGEGAMNAASLLLPFALSTKGYRRDMWNTEPGSLAHKIAGFGSRDGKYIHLTAPNRLRNNPAIKKGVGYNRSLLGALGAETGYDSYRNGGQMIKRADGSYSQRGLWDNIRDNKGSGKKPTKEMLQQEKKIKAKNK